MANKDVQFLTNHAIRNLTDAIKKLSEAKTYFTLSAMDAEATIVQDVIDSLLLKLAHVKVKGSKLRQQASIKHPLQDTLVDHWQVTFPTYGNFSPQEWKYVKDFFIALSLAYPRANEEFLKRVILNYSQSDAEWCSVKQFSSFARNFRYFVAKPIVNRNRIGATVAQISKEITDEHKDVTFRSIPGMPNVVVPVRKK